MTQRQQHAKQACEQLHFCEAMVPSGQTNGRYMLRRESIFTETKRYFLPCGIHQKQIYSSWNQVKQQTAQFWDVYD